MRETFVNTDEIKKKGLFRKLELNDPIRKGDYGTSVGNLPTEGWVKAEALNRVGQSVSQNLWARWFRRIHCKG